MSIHPDPINDIYEDERRLNDVPRKITLDTPTDEREVSHQMLSDRLRRRHQTLIERTLIGGRPTDLDQ